MQCVLLLLAVVSLVDGAGLRGARKQPEVKKDDVVDAALPTSSTAQIEGIELMEDDIDVAQISLVQTEATMHEKGAKSTVAAGGFHHAVQDVLDSFGARVIGDISGDVSQGFGVQPSKQDASDTEEAAANLELLQEIKTLKAEGVDLREQLELLDEDRKELEKGYAELMKNVSMANEFAGTAKSGLFNAPKPQLQMGSFDDLDNDEAAFEEKHKPHASHVEEVVALDANDPTLVEAMLHSVDVALETRHQEPLPSVRHAALLSAHAGLLAEKEALEQQNENFKQRIDSMQEQTRPFADKVLEATYNGVSLNMGVVGMSAPECDGNGGPGCQSRAWGR